MLELELFDGDKVTKKVDFGKPETGTINVKKLRLKNLSQYWPINNILFENTDKDIIIDYPKSSLITKIMEKIHLKSSLNSKIQESFMINGKQSHSKFFDLIKIIEMLD